MQPSSRLPAALAGACFLAALVACQPAAPPSPAPPSAAPASTPGDVPSPGATPATPAPTSSATASSVRATLVGTQPVIASEAGPAGHPYALPAAFAQGPDGSYVLFVVWFGAAPGDQVVTASTSADGRTWTVGRTPIYDDLGLGFGAPGPVPSSAVVLGDGTWVLYGWGSVTPGRTGFSTWRASASSPGGPWHADPGIVLAPGAPTAWDASTAAAATVLQVPVGWAMWYDGDRQLAGVRGEIGYATSPDGRAWSRAAEPVLHAGACGAGTTGAVVQPEVWPTSDGYRLAYEALAIGDATAAVYTATSADGRSWTCDGTAPLLTTSDIPGSEGIHRMHGGTIDGREVLFVESLGAHGSSIWLATLEPAR